jgi:hypothetical protein
MGLPFNARLSLSKAAQDQRQTIQNKISLQSIPFYHPARQLGECFSQLLPQCAEQHLPDYDAFILSVCSELLDHCLVLIPVEAEPFIDFLILKRGPKLPGNATLLRSGERYSERILPHFAPDRMMELTSCLARKVARYSVCMSASSGELNVRVYRAVLPMWLSSMKQHVVLLSISPVYARIAASRDAQCA